MATLAPRPQVGRVAIFWLVVEVRDGQNNAHWLAFGLVKVIPCSAWYVGPIKSAPTIHKHRVISISPRWPQFMRSPIDQLAIFNAAGLAHIASRLTD